MFDHIYFIFKFISRACNFIKKINLKIVEI